MSGAPFPPNAGAGNAIPADMVELLLTLQRVELGVADVRGGISRIEGNLSKLDDRVSALEDWKTSCDGKAAGVSGMSRVIYGLLTLLIAAVAALGSLTLFGEEKTTVVQQPPAKVVVNNPAPAAPAQHEVYTQFGQPPASPPAP